jgi:hypothetical protein
MVAEKEKQLRADFIKENPGALIKDSAIHDKAEQDIKDQMESC